MTDADSLAAATATLLTAHWGQAVDLDQVQVRRGAQRQSLQALAVGPGGRQAITATTGTPPGALPASMQARLLMAASAAGVAVPDPLCADDGDGPAGLPLLVTQTVPGEQVPTAVAALVVDADNGRTLVQQLGWALGALHRVPATGEAPVGTAPPDDQQGVLAELVDSQAAAALAGARAACAGLLQASPTFALGLAWLQERLPDPVPPVWLHGDLRPGHLVVAQDGLRAVLGWQHSRLGDPMEDLAWACLRCWRGKRPDAEVAGWWSREPLVAGYEEAGGNFDLERFHWWKVFGTLRRGLDLAELGRAHLDGRRPGMAAAAAGRRMAEQEYDLLTLLG